jgi:hypothetical protein
MRIRVAALISVMALQATAQNTPASGAFNTQTTITPLSQREASFAPTRVTKPRVFDRKFFVLAGIATATTVLDVAMTSHCISTYSNCQEKNPLFGSHPSAAKLYGVSFSMLGGQMLASAWMRREMPKRKLWMMPPIVATATHGLAAAFNFRTIHQLSSAQ